MALIMQHEERRGVNWFAVLVFLFLLLVIVGGGFLLFFGPTPLIETVAPAGLQATDRLAEAQFDSSKIVNDPVLQSFRTYGTVPSVGSVGRANPFAPY
jgi:hypothetical protein